MRSRQLVQRVEQYLDVVAKWIGYIGLITVLFGYASSLFNWGTTGPLQFIQDNVEFIWLSVLTLIVLILYIWTTRLNQRFTSRFYDSFVGDLHQNWDFEGPWRIAEPNTLLVTGSDAGGITKVGAAWENYTLTFDARILAICLGVVVRAQDLNNYYMFQITETSIRPHRRVAIPLGDEVPEQGKTKEDAKPAEFRLVLRKFGVAWQIFEPPCPTKIELANWFKVRIVVRGESIRIFINNELQLQQESFLKIATGKIGFRNSGNEAAVVRNVRVIVDP